MFLASSLIKFEFCSWFLGTLYILKKLTHLMISSQIFPMFCHLSFDIIYGIWGHETFNFFVVTVVICYFNSFWILCSNQESLTYFGIIKKFFHNFFLYFYDYFCIYLWLTLILFNNEIEAQFYFSSTITQLSPNISWMMYIFLACGILILENDDVFFGESGERGYIYFIYSMKG